VEDVAGRRDSSPCKTPWIGRRVWSLTGPFRCCLPDGQKLAATQAGVSKVLEYFHLELKSINLRLRSVQTAVDNLQKR
jgi:hypothetical protein